MNIILMSVDEKPYLMNFDNFLDKNVVV